MTIKRLTLSLFSALFILLLALAGIGYNAEFPVLSSGSVLTNTAAEQGAALSGWVQEPNGEWIFTFTPSPDIPELAENPELILCLNGTSYGQPSAALPAADRSGESFRLEAEPGQPITIRIRSTREPQGWLLLPRRAAEGFTFRTLLQLMTLTAFVTMAAVVLALYYYKHQPELGYFLLYLAVLAGWGAVVAGFPVSQGRWMGLIMRFFFSLTVMAPIWLSAALTKVRFFPEKKQRPLVFVLSSTYLLCSLSSADIPRLLALCGGMVYCIALLIKATEKSRSVLLLLLPCIVTTGLRIWVLLPGMQQSFFLESFSFYLIRCARVFDLPFALGCMVFVCRRFALQFDRTEQLARELDQRVIERTHALTEETEARKSMMLNIFHDLRSPLFAVSSGLETLEDAPEALPALLPALQQRVEFLRRLTEDLFLAAKLEQKQVLLNEDRAALNEAAAVVCTACRSEAEKKGVCLIADTAAPLPVWGDRVRLEQILQNLVTNAIHYTPAGGTITVTCKAQNGYALVYVRDTGCGIAPEDQTAVFDRYFHTTANTKHDSTGLGLTIAQELARLHHGEITLESEVGKGSCFTLVLPLLETD